jgi:putative phosphoribosyl transferase
VTRRPTFRDRREAGRALASRVAALIGKDEAPLVLALPRGGVPVGFEVAKALGADLDVFLVRKLGVPGHEEFAMGAIAGGGVRVLNEALIRELGLSRVAVDRVIATERAEIERREKLYRLSRPSLPVRGRTAILVDDGLATGSTMLAAVRAVIAQEPKRIIVAVPVASPEVCVEFRDLVDDVICAETEEPLHAVGLSYEDFSQTSDDEVRRLLLLATRQSAA